jgi:hypothetical protein
VRSLVLRDRNFRQDGFSKRVAVQGGAL